MKKENENLKNRTLQKKVKEMIEKSKKLGLIKPHTEAFKEFPVENEDHKGKKESLYR